MPLAYIDTDSPGYRRRRMGDRWAYFTETGRRLTSPRLIDRLNAIALPPAYGDAWFAKNANAHIQATGIDERGRKQYRYHPDYRAMQEAAKFGRCLEFGLALPRIRKAVDRDMRRGDLSRERVIAAVVRLLDTGAIRVGNEQYARTNGSFGATTLRNRHVQVSGQRVRLSYVGKSGRAHQISIHDARLARLMQRCRDLPGQHLFQYVGVDGAVQPISSTEVNSYLAAHGDFTAKHFRTWTASVIALEYLSGCDDRKSLKGMLDAVASRLGNTPAIARKSYVHPMLIDAARGDSPLPPLKARATAHHSRTERLLLNLLAAQLPQA